MAGLFLAQEVAGAADVEVVAGQLEAGAQRVERLQHLQAPLRRWRKQAAGGNGEQRIGPRLGPPDPAAQLIELGQAEHVGAMDDQGVGGRDVEARFDNRRRQKHVKAAVVKSRHHAVQVTCGHAAMSDADPRFRHLCLQEFLNFRQIGDAWHDVEGLAATQPFAQQRLAHRHGIEWRDERAYRKPVDRRRGDQRHVANAG